MEEVVQYLSEDLAGSEHVAAWALRRQI